MVANLSKRKKRGVIIATVVFILMMIIPIALVGVYFQTSNSLTSQEITKQQTLADLAAIALKIKLDTLVGIASSLASSPHLVADASAGQWSAAADVARDLQNNVNFYDTFIDRVSIYDASGTQQAAYPALTGGLGTNASDTAWYQTLISNGKSYYITNVVKRSSLPQIQVVNVAVPIKSNNEPVGFLILQIPTDNFLEFGENLSLGTYGFAYVVDPVGNIVAHPKYFSDSGAIINYSSVPEVSQVIEGNNGTDIVNGQNGEPGSVITYKPVEVYGWGIVIQELYSEAFSTRTGILFEIGLLIAILTLVNILVAYIILRILTEKKHD